MKLRNSSLEVEAMNIKTSLPFAAKRLEEEEIAEYKRFTEEQINEHRRILGLDGALKKDECNESNSNV